MEGKGGLEIHALFHSCSSFSTIAYSAMVLRRKLANGVGEWPHYDGRGLCICRSLPLIKQNQEERRGYVLAL